MKSALIADTGPLYAAVDPDDQYHWRAQRELKRLRQERRRLIVAYPTLLESYTLVLYRIGSAAAITWLQQVRRGTVFLNPVAVDYQEAASKVARFKDQKITLFDATVAVLAERFGLRIWTYDHHFDVMRAPVWR